jgi:hypothetical protein
MKRRGFFQNVLGFLGAFFLPTARAPRFMHLVVSGRTSSSYPNTQSLPRSEAEFWEDKVRDHDEELRNRRGYLS